MDYWRFEDDRDEPDCGEISSPVWGRLQALIEETVYKADDGTIYPVAVTGIDAGYQQSTVADFCSNYSSNVYPILGRDRPAKSQTIKEFGEFATQSGVPGFRITVDHYKDRMATVLRRDWTNAAGQQSIYHFNAPLDATDEQLKELTVEYRAEKKDPSGKVSYAWHRPSGSNNELWDLWGYGFALVEIAAYKICREQFELDTVDWPQLWAYLDEQAVFFTPPDA